MNATSTIAAVTARFPEAKRLSHCYKGEPEFVFSTGRSHCSYLASTYVLAGYRMGLSISFTPAGMLQTVSLRWPDEPIQPTPERRQENRTSMAEVFTAKYGRPVNSPTCHYNADSCLQWQADGAKIWHRVGERIHLDYYDAPKILFGSVTIIYVFDKNWVPVS